MPGWISVAVLTSPGQVCHEGLKELSRSIFQEVQVPSCGCRSVAATSQCACAV